MTLRALPFAVLAVLFACDQEGRAESIAPAQKPERARAYTGDTLPADQGPKSQGGTLRVALESEPPTLNYQLDPLDLWAKKIDDLLFDTLARPNPHTFVHEPRLAERWDVSDDKRTFTFYLRKDVRWHDKTPFTADDVVFTFDILRAKASKTLAVRGYLSSLTSVEKIDTHTVRFSLSEPYWYAFDVIAEMMIYPKHVYARGDFNTHPQNRNPIGTGAYKLSRWAAGDSITIERNPDYYGAPGYLDKIVFKVVPDPTVRLLMLKKGELDVVERVSPEIWKKLEDEPQLLARYFRLRHVPSGLQWLGWNTARPQLADKRVRRALGMLIDRQDIVDNLRLGLDRLATSWFYPGAKEYNEALLPLPYDARAAIALLEQAGFRDSDGDGVRDRAGTKLVLSFLYPAGNPFYEQLAGLLQSDLKRAGVLIEPQKLEWSAFMERIQKHDFDACSLLWQMAPRSDPYAIWHSSSVGGSNYIQYNNKDVDALLEGARREFDEQKRIAMYKRLSEILVDEQPYTMLFHRYNLSVVSKDLGGLTSTPYGIFRYEEIYRRGSP